MSLTPVQASPEARCCQDEQGLLSSPTLYPIRGGNEGFLQSIRET